MTTTSASFASGVAYTFADCAEGLGDEGTVAAADTTTGAAIGGALDEGKGGILSIGFGFGVDAGVGVDLTEVRTMAARTFAGMEYFAPLPRSCTSAIESPSP